MALKDALDHPDFWGPETTDEDRTYALSQSDRLFADKSPADKELFLKNLTKNRKAQERREGADQDRAAQASQEAQDAHRSWFQQNIADPVTSAVKVPFNWAGKLDVAAGLKTPEQAASRAESYSRFLVPQTATEAGIAVGTLGAGPVLGAAAKGARPLAQMLKGAGTASRAIPAAARITGAATGGAAGGALDTVGTDESAAGGALEGALKGGLAGVVGEGASYGVGKAMRSIPGAARRIEAKDTARIGETIGDINPALKDARVAGDINAMAGLKGESQLSKAYAQGVADINQKVSQVTPTLNLPSLGTVPFKDASQKLKDLNRAAHWDSPSPSDAMVAARDAARGLKKEIGQALQQVDHQTGAYNSSDSLEAAWRAVNRDYKTGQAIRDLLSRTGVYSGDTEGMRFVTQKLQAALKDPKVAAELERQLGKRDFNALVASITRGAPIGAQDKLASEAGPISARSLVNLLTRGGAGTVAGTAVGGPLGGLIGGLAGAVLLPNAATRYAGKTPYSVSERTKLLADLLAGKAVSKASEE